MVPLLADGEMVSPLFPHAYSRQPLAHLHEQRHPPQEEINHTVVPLRIVSVIHTMCHRLMRPSLCVGPLYSLPAAIFELPHYCFCMALSAAPAQTAPQGSSRDQVPMLLSSRGMEDSQWVLYRAERPGMG
jgi:hypothetical protein